MKELNIIQQGLKAPKGQKNSFGNYKYRSCEDILEAVKPLLGETVLTLTDDMVEVAGRIYVKATATLSTESDKVSVSAFARESETKKGMDDSQITGSASSYARKYALNGLFCIDDTKDADTMDNSKHKTKAPTNQYDKQGADNETINIITASLEGCKDIGEFEKVKEKLETQTYPYFEKKNQVNNLKAVEELVEACAKRLRG